MALWTVFAQVAEAADPPPRRGNPLQSDEIIWGTLALTGALLAGAILVYLTDKWRKRNERPDDDAAVLSGYRAMYENGEITEAEYAELRNRVAAQMKPRPAARAGGAAQPAHAPPPAPNPPPGAPDQPPPAH